MLFFFFFSREMNHFSQKMPAYYRLFCVPSKCQILIACCLLLLYLFFFFVFSIVFSKFDFCSQLNKLLNNHNKFTNSCGTVEIDISLTVHKLHLGEEPEGERIFQGRKVLVGSNKSALEIDGFSWQGTVTLH